MSLTSLRDLIDDANLLFGVELAREARRLSDVALAELSAAGDEGVWEATRSATYAEVAAQLGVTVWAVGKAVRRHNARQKALTEGTETDTSKRKQRAKAA